jgi:hypothetical protein
MRAPRILNRSAQGDEPQSFEERAAEVEAQRNAAARSDAGAPEGVKPVRDIAIRGGETSSPRCPCESTAPSHGARDSRAQ